MFCIVTDENLVPYNDDLNVEVIGTLRREHCKRQF